MEISKLGKVAFVERLTKPFSSKSDRVVRSFKDDCAVVDCGDKFTLLTSEVFTEGVHFDLVLSPLKHLGYKCVVATLSDIIAMNGKAESIMVALAIPARFSVENIEELYEGVKIACEDCGVELVGGDTTASINGLIISVSGYGSVDKDCVTYRSGAKLNDLICVSGDLGGAYLGVNLLEREKKVLHNNQTSTPKFDGFEYQLAKALKPKYRKDIVDTLKENSIQPTSMIDISDGLASEILHICKESNCSANIYLDKLPIASSTYSLAEELKSDAVIASMNGGEDYQLLFTIDISQYDKVSEIEDISVIGHITEAGLTPVLETPDGATISIQAQGWGEVE